MASDLDNAIKTNDIENIINHLFVYYNEFIIAPIFISIW